MPWRKESRRLPKHKPVVEMTGEELWTFLAIVMETTEVLLERIWAIVRILAVATLLSLACWGVSTIQLTHRNHTLDRLGGNVTTIQKEVESIKTLTDQIEKERAAQANQATVDANAVARTLRQVDILCRANPICAAQFPSNGPGLGDPGTGSTTTTTGTKP